MELNLKKPKGIIAETLNRDEVLSRAIATADFKRARNSLEAVVMMFDQLFPTMKYLTEHNTELIIEQEKVLKNYADLHEKHKLLEKEFEEYKEKYPENKASIGESVQGSGEEEA